MALAISVSAPDGSAVSVSDLPANTPLPPAYAAPASPAGSVLTVAVAGELDLATAPELLNRVNDLIEAGHHRVVLDLGELTFCDSAGLSALARLRKKVAQFDGSLALARPTHIVRSVLELTGMTEVIPTFATVREAIASVA